MIPFRSRLDKVGVLAPFAVFAKSEGRGAFGNFILAAQNGTKRAQNNDTLSGSIGQSGGADLLSRIH